LLRSAVSRATAVVICAAAAAVSVAVSDAAADELRLDRPHLVIPRVPRPPTLEEFLDMEPPSDLVEHLALAEGMIQQNPIDGEPASQRTEIYLGYDEINMYVIFVAFDDEPEKVRAHMSPRENFFGDDTVEVQFDTYRDERRAFSFLTNPFGNQWDAIWTEGRGFDMSWSTVWESRGERTDRGYVVWMAIPFKSLRFQPTQGVQEWGIVFVRDIPRNNEVSFWPRISKRIQGRLNQEATASGMVGVAPGRNLWLIPYATARRYRVRDEESEQFEREGSDPQAGLDVKWVIRDTVTADLAINPDFGQIESDRPQVTANQRFEVFFPETRPFFLEYADLFRTPVNLVFTRRINDPKLGGRVTGRVGKYAFGAFAMNDETPDEKIDDPDLLRGEKALHSVLRFNRDLFGQSRIGLIYTGRDLADSYNRVGGIDGRFKLGPNWETQFQWVTSSTRTLATEEEPVAQELSDPAYDVAFNRSGLHFDAHIHFIDIGEEFRSQAGFVPRTDVRDRHAQLNYTFRPDEGKLVSWGPRLFLLHVEDHDGLRLDSMITPSFQWEFYGQTFLRVFVVDANERLRVDDADGLTEDTDFSTDRIGGSFNTHWFDPVELHVEYTVGDASNLVQPEGEPPAPADITSGGVRLNLWPLTKLRVDVEYLLTELDDDATGERIFKDEIFRTRWNWQFNSKLSLRAILRYDSTKTNPALTNPDSLPRRRNFNGDLLVTYLVNPWTAFYLGYNSNYRNEDVVDAGMGNEITRTSLNDSRQLFVKLTYLFRP
jgi:hypothetical protein